MKKLLTHRLDLFSLADNCGIYIQGLAASPCRSGLAASPCLDYSQRISSTSMHRRTVSLTNRR